MIREHIINRVMARRGRLHIFDSIDARRTALVVIDMQKTFCEPGAPAEVAESRSIIKPINRLAAALREAGGKVVWCTHANMGVDDASDWRNFFDHFVSDELRSRTVESLSPGGSGQDIWHELETRPDDIKLFKNRYSALIASSSQLERILRSLNIDTLLIAGTKTNICCESTARDAMMLDFKTIMVSDATAALSPEEHRSALENVIQQFGDVMSTDEIIQLL